jgi:hypothetical protein
VLFQQIIDRPSFRQSAVIVDNNTVGEYFYLNRYARGVVAVNDGVKYSLAKRRARNGVIRNASTKQIRVVVNHVRHFLLNAEIPTIGKTSFESRFWGIKSINVIHTMLSDIHSRFAGEAVPF